MADRRALGEDQPAGRQRRGPLVAGLSVQILLCVGCCAAGLALQMGTAGSVLNARYVVQACVGPDTQPRLQDGVTWIASSMSSLPPVRLQNPVCVLLRWPPNPPRGGLALPP